MRKKAKHIFLYYLQERFDRQESAISHMASKINEIEENVATMARAISKIADTFESMVDLLDCIARNVKKQNSYVGSAYDATKDIRDDVNKMVSKGHSYQYRRICAHILIINGVGQVLTPILYLYAMFLLSWSL